MRKVTIVNNNEQRQNVIENSEATTLGELKAELLKAGIPFEGCTFLEGHMRAELVDDAAPLPETVMFRGQPTTDLVFLLTTPSKKVNSGSERTDIYGQIKSLKLEDECYKRFGKNFTQCKTSDLKALVEEKSSKKGKKAAKVAKADEVTKVMEKDPVQAMKEAVGYYSVEQVLMGIVSALHMEGILTDEVSQFFAVSLMEASKEEKEAPAKPAAKKANEAEVISQEEIDELFDWVR